MPGPRLRTPDRYPPPYPLNRFPSDFASKVGKRLIYLLATRPNPSIEGDDWEQTFAAAIGANWKRTSTGLDDIDLGTCAWGAKTVKSTRPFTAENIRLISGRNSPDFSYGRRPDDPNLLGNMVLGIWNERVNNARSHYHHVRTVVLLKGIDWEQFSIYELPTEFYPIDRFRWEYNDNNNLRGFHKETGTHTFTWQPHGSQFTIIRPVPADKLRLRLRRPPSPTETSIEDFLDGLGYNDAWIRVQE